MRCVWGLISPNDSLALTFHPLPPFSPVVVMFALVASLAIFDTQFSLFFNDSGSATLDNVHVRTSNGAVQRLDSMDFYCVSVIVHLLFYREDDLLDSAPLLAENSRLGIVTIAFPVVLSHPSSLSPSPLSLPPLSPPPPLSSSLSSHRLSDCADQRLGGIGTDITENHSKLLCRWTRSSATLIDYVSVQCSVCVCTLLVYALVVSPGFFAGTV